MVLERNTNDYCQEPRIVYTLRIHGSHMKIGGSRERWQIINSVVTWDPFDIADPVLQ